MLSKELSNQVWSNDLLRDRILSYVVQDNNGRNSTANTRACRLVNSSWLQSVRKCVRKSRKALLSASVPRYNQDKTLEKFANIVTNLLCENARRPSTTSISVLHKYFRREGVQDITDGLSRFAAGLVTLRLEVPYQEPGQEPAARTNLDLPILQTLDIRMHQSAYLQNERWDEFAPVKQYMNVTSLIQAVSEGSRELKNFSLSGSIYKHDRLPPGFEKVHLPSTLIKVELKRALRSDHLLGLMDSPMPHLTTLTLPFCFDPFENNVVFTVLNKYRHTLKHLTLLGVDVIFFDNMPSVIQLPEMKSLETLNVFAGNIKWPWEGPAAKLEELLPALKTIRFKHQDFVTYSNWTSKSRWETVENLEVQLEFAAYIYNRERSTMLTDYARLTCNAFPKTLQLDITLDVCSCFYGLLHLFNNSKQLEDLKVTFTWKGGRKWDNADYTALVLGTPVEWKEAVVADKFHLSPIVNMAGLRKLTVVKGYMDNRVPLMWDVLFQVALKHMPNLQEISLGGGFQVSSTTAEEWQNAGRVLEITKNYTDGEDDWHRGGPY